jgi:hypothetical protein
MQNSRLHLSAVNPTLMHLTIQTEQEVKNSMLIIKHVSFEAYYGYNNAMKWQTDMNHNQNFKNHKENRTTKY